MKLKCNKCNQEKQTNTNQMKKLIETYGSKENLISKYICRSCIKPAPKIEKKQTQLDVEKEFEEMNK